MAKTDKSDTIKKEFLEVLGSVKGAGNVSVTCKLIGISRDTAYRYRKDDEEFENGWLTAIKEGRRIMSDEAEFRLREQIGKGNITAIIFTLKSYRPSVYREKFELRGKGDEPIQVSMPTVDKYLRKLLKEKGHGQNS